MNKIILLVITLFPTLASAHEVHGTSFMENIWHVLASPEHAWPLTIAVVLVAIGIFVKQRS
jgi:hypothetical protein